MCAVVVRAYEFLRAYMLSLFIDARSNDTESTEEGEVFGYQSEDQGQAEKGKPSKLVAYLILVFLLHYL
jgi:hypothetical protein